MNKYSILLNGMFPRSEELIRATRNFDRQRISSVELLKTLQNQQNDLINFQKKLNLPVLSDGMLNWQDHFRPFTDIFSGIKSGILTRFTNTNTFFRQPQITGPIKYTGKKLNLFFKGVNTPGKWNATLPAPFYFARLSNDRHYRSIKKTALAYTSELVKLIKKLRKYGYCSFQLFDPYLGYSYASNNDLNLVHDTTQVLIKKTSANIGYQISYTGQRKIFQILLKTDLSSIGVDFFNTDISSMPSFRNKTALYAGCLDSRTSLVEDPKTLSSFLKSAERSINPTEIKAGANLDLQFVPVPLAMKKIFNLNSAITKLKQ